MNTNRIRLYTLTGLLAWAVAVGAPAQPAQPPRNEGAPPARPTPTPQFWFQTDRDMLQLKSELSKTEIAIDKVFDEIETERSQYDPGQLTLRAVAANQKLRDLYRRQHQLRNKRRQALIQLVPLANDLNENRSQWEALLPDIETWLKSRKGRAAVAEHPGKNLAKRLALWRRALEAKGRKQTLETLLGEDLGQLVYLAEQMSPEGDWGGRGQRMGQNGGRDGKSQGQGMGGNRPGAGNPPWMGADASQMRERWERRLDRLAKRQEELAKEMESQQQEIKKLRRMIQWADMMAPPIELDGNGAAEGVDK